MVLSMDQPGLTVDVAGNGLEALSSFENRRQAVVVMDLRMPEMDGLGGYRAIRGLCEQVGCPVPAFVFCTGYAPPKAIEELLKSSSAHVLLYKPVRMGKLREAVLERL